MKIPKFNNWLKDNIQSSIIKSLTESQSLTEGAKFDLEGITRLINAMPSDIKKGLNVESFLKDLNDSSKDNKVDGELILKSLSQNAKLQTQKKMLQWLNIASK